MCFDNIPKSDIVTCLLSLCQPDIPCKYYNRLDGLVNDLEEVMYQLHSMAQNEYNKEYWQTLYEVLQIITDNFNNGQIVNECQIVNEYSY